ncbi:two-component sensor histidine kinase [Virgisporangium aliadipatigenens]|uniref:histidine kinase n=1 Tax=Virgisporangium aliadipatigenens TaxID=741659 RepID=A0A8J3YJH1_9ACTN|nr:two-component sensor histidine kinase [Virgisporangium aliadipatigenens]
MRLRTLTSRAVLAGVAVALLSVLVTAMVAAPLAARAAERQARDSLRTQAGIMGELLRSRLQSPRTVDEQRLVAQWRTLGIDAYLIRGGRADRPGLPAALVSRVAGGQAFSGKRLVGGRMALVEGRPLGNGNGVVLARHLATGFWRQVLGAMGLPLTAGLAAGVLAGTLLGRRLARPIRHAAGAANRLRAGERGVRLNVEPPQEVADLAFSLNALAAALEVSEGRQREFLLSVSHELRTPLTAIRGYAEALADGVVEGDAAVRAGETVLGQAQQLERLVTDLLALARLDAVEFALAPMEVDLSGLVRDAAQAWAPRCAAEGVELRVEAPAGVVRAFTDPGRTRQILDGLLDNALRVVPAGAPVVLCARSPAILEIRDGGPGLSDADLAVAFDKGALNRRYQGVRPVGSGLGLALVAGLARRLNGHIEAGHAPEGGARFTVALPLPDPNTRRTNPWPGATTVVPDAEEERR